jgi:hypothetical protein
LAFWNVETFEYGKVAVAEKRPAPRNQGCHGDAEPGRKTRNLEYENGKSGSGRPCGKLAAARFLDKRVIAEGF